MTKLVGLIGLLALFVTPAMAQDNSTSPQDQPPTAPAAPSEPVKAKHTYITPKFEISGGFTDRGFYGANGTTVGMKGGFASVDYNFFRWIGLEGEFLRVTGTVHFPTLPPESLDVYTALIGPKIYPLGHRKLTPFAHVLFGAGILGSAVPAFAGYGGNSSTKEVTAFELGGGLDFNLASHWGIRLIQLDYGDSKFLGPTVPRQGSKRVSVGVVYRFGQR
jgi:opacity protein-like surface antigen